ncbi:unnamed protein product [Lupinus luteus]|uniref:Uncharacterized protein n=1 Tax=Lupinus luteus TaxID=3873 RepID=A0AAV1WJK8_LUPLU
MASSIIDSPITTRIVFGFLRFLAFGWMEIIRPKCALSCYSFFKAAFNCIKKPEVQMNCGIVMRDKYRNKRYFIVFYWVFANDVALQLDLTNEDALTNTKTIKYLKFKINNNMNWTKEKQQLKRSGVHEILNCFMKL